MLSRALAILGLLAMLVGGVDPLEGSVIIVPGLGVVTIGAILGRSRYTRMLYASVALIAIGIGTMFLATSRETGGQSMGRMVSVSAYTLGFLLGVIAAFLRLVEIFRKAPAPARTA